jgi:hypothetical protein
MDRREMLSFEYMRRELVNKLARGPLRQDEMDELHRLDKITAGYDIVGMLFDEIEEIRYGLGHALNMIEDPAEYWNDEELQKRYRKLAGWSETPND